MSFQLGKFKGVPLVIHWSFTVLLLGIVGIISYLQDIQTGILYGIGAVALFASVVIHEFMHTYVAYRFGYDTEEIVLYPLGGMSKIEELPTDPKQEFLIAFMGPVTNFIIAGVLYLLFLPIADINITILGRSLIGLVNYYIVLNVALGMFNMFVPAIPMDGGRLLRSILATQMSFPRATQTAVIISKGIAILMVLVGLALNFWLSIIGGFIYIASSSELEESITRFILEDIPLSQIPQSEVVSVSPEISIDDLLEKMLEYGHTGYLVRSDSKDLGIVTLSDIQEVSPDTRDKIKVEEIMTKRLITVSGDATAKDVLQILQSRDIGRVFIKENNIITGVVTRSDIVKYIQIKSLQKASSTGAKSISSQIDNNAIGS